MAAAACAAGCRAPAPVPPSSSAAPSAQPAGAPASIARCTALRTHIVPPGAIGLPTQGAVVESASIVEASEPGNTNGTYCRITGAIKALATDTPDIRFEVNLPAQWNGRALQMGGGGYSGEVQRATGTVSYASGRAPLSLGYVTLGSDTGHVGNAARADFALNDEAVENFGYGHIKKTHDVAIALIRFVYGRDPQKMYYAGGSTGGREGYTAIERYPIDYDGVIANAPALNFSGVRLFGLMVGRSIYLGTDGFLPPDKQKLVHARVLAECDALDGATDGIISNVEACRAREAQTIASLRCEGGGGSAAGRAGSVPRPAPAIVPAPPPAPASASGAPADVASAAVPDLSLNDSTPAAQAVAAAAASQAGPAHRPSTGLPCLTDSQIETLTTLRDGMTLPYALAHGVQTYPGYNVLEGTDMSGMLGLGGSPVLSDPPTFAANGYLFSQGDAYFKYFVTRDAHAAGIHFNPLTPGRYAQRLVDLSATVGAMDPDISEYIVRGGKLITMQGLADEVISPNQTIAFYKTLAQRYGQSRVDSFMRLYMVPGYQHGNGVFIPIWDGLRALDEWSTHGVAPEGLVAVDTAAATHGRSRPLCRYPSYPRYTGRGDIDSAASFVCTPP
ncbi:tannase/feruloyl esterase family alpha/beta hydrolase [Pararobbsia silviterrae]|uniref:tannase/feruloyl esterase family alpha/beta hydrolase n=1 Tax=Pararobbsia silviterrae TaxID=1792498 RepID=UPI0013142743|nr:tannase/feruloyl esterase family alpha/beta hydrolase [Pararobbsia silviterrae]